MISLSQGMRNFGVRGLLALCCLLFCGQAAAQHIISGRVVSDNEPMMGIHVQEVDNDNRIISHTVTDANGFYSMKVSRGSHKLVVKTTGFRPFVQPIRGQTTLNIELIPRIAMADAALLDEKHPVAESYHLLYGLLRGRKIPQLVRVELLNDSTFTLVPPIHSNGLNEIYPAENVMIFVDAVDRHMLLGITPRDAYTIVGRPEDIDSKILLTQRRWGSYEDDRSEMRGDVNTYPQFVFSTKRLKHMFEEEARPSRVLIETAAKDNYWILYPADNYEKELQRILNKLQKKLKKSKSKNR